MDRAGQRAVRGLLPHLQATLLQPGIHHVKIGKARHLLQDLAAGVLNVLLDLSLLPACGRIAELRFEDIVVRHGQKAEVDLPLLASADPVHRRAHVIVYAALGHAAEHTEAMPVGIEQHLVGLERVGAQQEGPAV